MTPREGVAWLGTKVASLRSAMAAVVAAGLVASLLGAAPAVAAQPAAESSPPVGRPETPAVADERSALTDARQRGERVEILSARTEYSQTFATPHGMLAVDEYVQPQWVRSPAGAWVDVDPSLELGADGSWSPRVTTAEMRFSDGGVGAPLASISTDGVAVGLRWPEPLPEPVVDGNVATYRNVAPMVDLQIVADVEGFTHLVVIHSPKALENPALQEIVLGTELSGVSLEVTETGAVAAVDGSGTVVFSGPSPMMWDSRDATGTPPEVEKEEAEAAPADAQPGMVPVPVEVSAGKLTLTPDLDMLSDPETVYPVYVDPTWTKVTGKRNKWSLLRKSFPSSSFYNPAVGSTSSSDSTKGIVRAGFVVEDRTYTDRSIFNMSTSAVKYKRVNKAVFSLTQGWSYYNCGHSSPPTTQLRSVGSFSSSTTWNSQPSWGSVLATSKKIRKYGHSCGPQRVEFSVTGHVRSAAGSGKASVNLGLRAASESTGSWTRFKTDAKLSMEYNTAPNAPNTVKVQGKGCATGSSRPYVTVDRPAFSAKIGDKDSGQQSMTTRFYWWRSGQSRNGTDFVSGTSANPGTANSSSIPSGKALADRVVYKYQARTSDGIDVTWSSVCEFRAWLTPPNPPSGVSSAAYPEYDPDDPGTGSGGVGISGQFTILPPASGVADVVGYAYTMDSGVSASAAPVVAKGSGGSATVSLRPRRDGVNVLRVWSKDVAGRFSTVVEYRFRVRPGDGAAAQWLFDNPEGVGEDDTGHGNPVGFFNGATTGAGAGQRGIGGVAGRRG